MLYRIKRLIDCTTVEAVCIELERMVEQLRNAGEVSRLPDSLREIAAISPSQIRRWRNALTRSPIAHTGRLDKFFILFDSALARVEILQKESHPVLRYKIYTESGAQTARLNTKTCQSLDEAARTCISMHDRGKRIVGVRLPVGLRGWK
jgi:hypothetical protein